MLEKTERAGQGRSVKELLLFHGTDSLDTVRGIAINNFDHRLSGKHATMYGEGAYFAKKSKYSHAYTKPPDRFMFLVRVLVGEYTKGESSYKRPPSKPGAAHVLFDSCVDSITKPSIYIVFDTKQYYPEFLIQYHTIVESRVSTRKPAALINPVMSASNAVNNPSTARRRSRSPHRTIGSLSEWSYTGYLSSSPAVRRSSSPSPSLIVHIGGRRKTRAPSPPPTVYPQPIYSANPSSSHFVQRPRTPSPPTVYPQHTSAYTSSSRTRSPSPPRQATMFSVSNSQDTSQPEKAKEMSCVLQ